MPEPTSVGRRAQHSCASDPQHSDDELDTLANATLAGELRAHYAQHTELAPCLDSTAELAARFVPHVFVIKPAHAERQVQRANVLIRQTYRDRFREQRRRYGRTTLPVARWIEKPGGSGRSDLFVSRDEVDLRIGDLEQRARADRAGPRRSAFRSAPLTDRANTRAREVRGSRRRAVPHGVTNPPLLEVAPVSLAGLAALRATHSGAFQELAAELRRQSYHDHPVEACRAVRTLAERDSATPLVLLRHLFKRARNGDPLIDKAETERITDEQERAARTHYGWDPESPWPDLIPDGTAGPPDEFDHEDPGRELVRKRLEAELELERKRREAERIVEALIVATLRPRGPSAAERFLALVSARGRVRIDLS